MYLSIKKIVGLQEIITENPPKLANGNIKNEIPDVLSNGKVQINGLIGDMYYKPNLKCYIIKYGDGRKGFYPSEIILDAVNKGEIIYNREEVRKNDSAEPIKKKQQEKPATTEEIKLPEGAEWKLNSSGKYILKIKGKDGGSTSYPAEYASKKSIIAFKCKSLNVILNALTQIQRNFEKV